VAPKELAQHHRVFEDELAWKRASSFLFLEKPYFCTLAASVAWFLR
jgi:hypothetical protein